jgi:hypothetical protein
VSKIPASSVSAEIWKIFPPEIQEGWHFLPRGEQVHQIMKANESLETLRVLRLTEEGRSLLRVGETFRTELARLRHAVRQRFGRLPSLQELTDYFVVRLGRLHDEVSRMTVNELVELLQRDDDEPVDDNKAATRPSCPITITNGTVYLSGSPVLFNLTPERNDDALHFLTVLIDQRGGWVSSPEIGRVSNGESKVGVRWDRLRKKLPDELQKHVESHHRFGYRIVP